MASTAPRARPVSRARALRLALIAIVAAGLAPGTFVRAPMGPQSAAAQVRIAPLAVRGGTAGALTLSGVFELTCDHRRFGGFSALVAGEGQSLVAGTDRGYLLDIDLSGPAPRAVPGSFRFVGDDTRVREEIIDLESLARDPASGTLWAAFESDNLVMRYAAGASPSRRAPGAMAGWSRNSGAETMERLADGRFLVIAEGAAPGSDTAHEALLFPGDPLEAGEALRFRFASEAGYDPVDAAQLPDGRVLILLRRVEYALPARFDTAIAIADPREIRAGAAWRARIIQRLSGGALADNFEGIAYVPSAADPARGALWVIADDNFSLFQRSLLVRFDWSAQTAGGAPSRVAANEKAPGNPDA